MFAVSKLVRPAFVSRVAFKQVAFASTGTTRKFIKVDVVGKNKDVGLITLDRPKDFFVEEDYLEEEYLDEETEKDYDQLNKHPDPNQPSHRTIQPDEIVAMLEVEKAKNIEVVECNNPQSPYKYLVIASPYNDRHGSALIEKMYNYFCKKNSFGILNPQKGIQSNGWYTMDFHNGILHIMKKELRERYNLAKVWSDDDPEARVDEDEIDADMIPTQTGTGSSRTRATPIFKS